MSVNQMEQQRGLVARKKEQVIKMKKITNRKKIVSDYDNTFEYKLMEDIEIQDFDLMYNAERVTGVHFFWDFESAKNYN